MHSQLEVKKLVRQPPTNKRHIYTRNEFCCNGSDAYTLVCSLNLYVQGWGNFSLLWPHCRRQTALWHRGNYPLLSASTQSFLAHTYTSTYGLSGWNAFPGLDVVRLYLWLVFGLWSHKLLTEDLAN